MNEGKIKIFCDGGARGNPGPAGIGIVIVGPKGEEKRINKYIGIKTNNQAEYEALYYGIDKANKNYPKIKYMEIYLDSELVVKQMEGKYKVKNEELGRLLITIKNLVIERNLIVEFYHIRREKNHQADKLVNLAIDKETRK